MKCPFCSGNTNFLYDVKLNNICRKLLTCEICSSCFLDSNFSDQELISFYSDSYFSEINSWQEHKSKLLASDYFKKYLSKSFLNREKKILEIGSSFGHFADLLHKNGFQVSAMEVSSYCCKYISQKFPDIQVVGSTLDDLNSTEFYDIILCQHVIEHINDNHDFFKKISKHLSPGGLFAALTPSSNSESFRKYGLKWGWACPNQHFQFFSPKIPNSFFEQFGLSVLDIDVFAPHAIHFPSSWKCQIDQLIEKIDSFSIPLASPSIIKKIISKLIFILKKILFFFSSKLRQNVPGQKFLIFERFINGLNQSINSDELFLLLRKNSN